MRSGYSLEARTSPAGLTRWKPVPRQQAVGNAGRSMGYYRIGPKIGSGGMAEVYLGLHEAIGGFQKLVVMKRLSGCQSRDREAVDRLLAEARLAASINHPNIVST